MSIVADREADFYEPIQRCQRREVDFAIRAYRDLPLADAPGYLKDALAPLPVRSGPLRFKGPERPGGVKPDFTVNVVEVRETDAPPGVEPLQWVLLTSLPCQRRTEVQRIVERYATRWWIEGYQKALKGGVGVEASQLQCAHRIETLLAVLAIVAVRLLNAKWLARTRGGEPVAPDVFAPKPWSCWPRALAHRRAGGRTAPPPWWPWRARAGSWRASTTACRVGKPSGVAGNGCCGCVKD